MGKGNVEQTTQVQQTVVQSQETNVDSIKALRGNIDGLIQVLNTQAQNPSKPTTYDLPIILNAPPAVQAPPTVNVPVTLPSLSVPVTVLVPNQPQPVANTTGPGQDQYQNDQLRSLLSSMYLSLIEGQPAGKVPPASNITTLLLMAAIVIIAIWYFRR